MDFEKVKDEIKDENIWFEGGKGDSMTDAVIIRGTKKNPFIGVSAEKVFISNKWGVENSDWYFDSRLNEIVTQSLHKHQNQKKDQSAKIVKTFKKQPF